MPIKGLTDRPPQFPRIGVIRKGAPKTGNKPGKDLSYFRFTSDYPDVLKTWDETFGATPDKINMYLPYATADENFQTWREEWAAGGLVHRCDGETCVIVRTAAGTYAFDPVPCPGGCKQVGRLSVIIPDLGRLAYVTVTTTSTHDILELSTNLKAFELMGRGSLTGIPFVLSRVPREISVPKPDGSRVRMTKYLLHIEPETVFADVLMVAAKTAALTALKTLTVDAQYSLSDGRPPVMSLVAGMADNVDLADDDDDLADDDLADNDLVDNDTIVVDPADTNATNVYLSDMDDLSPAQLVDWFRLNAVVDQRKPTNGQLTACRAAFGKLYKERDQKVALVRAIWGIESTNDLNRGMVVALLDWFAADASNGYELPARVKYQAAQIVDHVLLSN